MNPTLVTISPTFTLATLAAFIRRSGDSADRHAGPANVYVFTSDSTTAWATKEAIMRHALPGEVEEGMGVLKVVQGAGAGSHIKITFSDDTLRLAGVRMDLAVFDREPDDRLEREVVHRLMHRDGEFWRVEWFRRATER